MDENPSLKNFDQRNVLPDEIRAKLAKHVDDNWDKIIMALTDLATGLWYEDLVLDKATQEPIKVRVYKQKPDGPTAQYLANQVIGKPKESMNVEGKVNLIMDV